MGEDREANTWGDCYEVIEGNEDTEGRMNDCGNMLKKRVEKSHQFRVLMNICLGRGRVKS
jgi:hypothetical protein